MIIWLSPLAYENLWHAPALFFVAANQMILYLPLQKFAQAVSRSMEDAHTANGNKGPIDLTPREFELLACLMRNAGKVVSREDLLHDAWGWEFITETKTVDTHIKRLRDKIEAAGYDPKLVETVRGYGYRFKK